MYKQLRNDGFTLVEIIVSIAIGTVVLGLVLSMITTAFSNFGSASNTNLKKSSLDGIVSYVRGCVLNASDVVVSTTKPDGDDWKWLYVSNGMLYKGSKSGESKVFDYRYYNKKSDHDKSSSAGTLEMNVTMKHDYVAKDDNHVYSGKFSYELSDHKEKFTRDDTTVFSNITGTSSSYNGDVQKISQNDNQEYNLNTDLTSLKLYYKKTASASSDDNKQTGSYAGTIMDKIKAMTPEVNRGYFMGTADSVSTWSYLSEGNYNYLNMPAKNEYRLGDFVYYQGYWYVLVKNDNPVHNLPGNGSGVWQKLSDEYEINNPYVKGDVIKYNGVYYRVVADYLSSGDVPTQWDTINWENNGNNPSNPLFKYIGSTPDSKHPGYDTNWNDIKDTNREIRTLLNGSRAIPDKSPAKIKQQVLNGVSTYATNYDDFSNVTKFTVADIDAKKFNTDKFEKGALVAVEVKNSGKGGSNDDKDAPYYRLYQKIFNPVENLTYMKTIPGNSSLSGWRLLENSYSPSSSYESGDILRLGTSKLNDADTTNYIQLNKISVPENNLNFTCFIEDGYYDGRFYKRNIYNSSFDVEDNGSLPTLFYFSLNLSMVTKYDDYHHYYYYESELPDYWISCKKETNYYLIKGLKGSQCDNNYLRLEKAMIHKVGLQDETDEQVGKALWTEMSYNDALNAS